MENKVIQTMDTSSVSTFYFSHFLLYTFETRLLNGNSYSYEYHSRVMEEKKRGLAYYSMNSNDFIWTQEERMFLRGSSQMQTAARI